MSKELNNKNNLNIRECFLASSNLLLTITTIAFFVSYLSNIRPWHLLELNQKEMLFAIGIFIFLIVVVFLNIKTLNKNKLKVFLAFIVIMFTSVRSILEYFKYGFNPPSLFHQEWWTVSFIFFHVFILFCLYFILFSWNSYKTLYRFYCFLYNLNKWTIIFTIIGFSIFITVSIIGFIIYGLNFNPTNQNIIFQLLNLIAWASLITATIFFIKKNVVKEIMRY